ncbi:SulP family inorganic anion transporter [Cellulomonas carbonis]|uniref:MFS transporter n=1 Tax=Cellulomonas carbonis T26 TaxID=947969 RepID=A0A0A0BR50_9CELL|nr:SulP family inorganic anion transporter [Cellulomonas carbonis]KGM10948.1 MFS transporter [Cellulomonas carbonis T26]GGC02304.1 sulfate permease [Cellulomonas carbonis]
MTTPAATLATATHPVATAVRTAARRTLPRRADYADLPRTWRADLVAGATVAVVALPLALGFGVTSGVGAAAGLVTAIVAGLVAAVFGGSNLQVSGPTGAMTVVLVPIVARYGPESVATVAVMAGGLVVVGGLLGLGRLVAYIPWPVVEGFTFGIGVTIALQQVPLALDTAKADGENAGLVALRTLALVDWSAAWRPLALVALVVVLMTMLPRWRRGIPASLVAVVVATVAAEAAHLDTTRIGTLPSTLPTPTLPLLTPEATSALVSAAVAVAALAALESLLSARVADGMADDLPRTEPNRELVGQGLANVASGLFGGIPATGAIARTAVNVRSGARTRAAAALHAVVLAVVVLAAAPLVSRIPLSALAGVLLVTAVRMVDVPTARAILRSGRSGALVLLLTFATTIVFDLVVAVELGVAAAAVLALRAMARASGLHREPIDDPELDAGTEHALLHEHIAVYRIDGALFFADVRRFLDELMQVTDVRVVVLRLSGVRVLDASGANALAQVVADLQRRGVVVLLKGLRPEHRRVVEAVGVLDALQHEKHLFDTLPDAIEHARSHVRRSVVVGG